MNWKLNLSTDLRRIAWWLQQGDVKAADQFLSRIPERYPLKNNEVYGKKSLSEWFAVINRKDNNHSAESALTLSQLLQID